MRVTGSTKEGANGSFEKSKFMTSRTQDMSSEGCAVTEAADATGGVSRARVSANGKGMRQASRGVLGGAFGGMGGSGAGVGGGWVDGKVDASVGGVSVWSPKSKRNWAAGGRACDM